MIGQLFILKVHPQKGRKPMHAPRKLMPMPPFARHTGPLSWICPGIIGLLLAAIGIASATMADTLNAADIETIQIEHPEPDPRGGKAYRLVYYVMVPIEVYWRFKTDFDNDFLEESKFIIEHRFVSRTNDTVITESRHLDGPDVFFRWQTTVFAEAYRLTFELLNPEEAGQRFHFGEIELSAEGQVTRVVQTAYFDFWGAALWAKYPWRGGMRHFLQYTAQWEQETILNLKHKYTGNPEGEQ
jgi:hypothetical protein